MFRVLLAIAVVGSATFVLVVADADLTIAAVALLLVAAGASVFGYTTGLVAAITSATALTYYFTSPVHSFGIDQARQ